MATASTLPYVFDDGGRSKYFKPSGMDCVTRSIAIVTERDYKEVYDFMFGLMRKYDKKRRSPRNGVPKKVWRRAIDSIGGKWHPTMHIGSGCTTHLRPNEVPMNGKVIIETAGHLTALIDGVIHDIFDAQEDGNRCVYGYYTFD